MTVPNEILNALRSAKIHAEDGGHLAEAHGIAYALGFLEAAEPPPGPTERVMIHIWQAVWEKTTGWVDVPEGLDDMELAEWMDDHLYDEEIFDKLTSANADGVESIDQQRKVYREDGSMVSF